MSELERHGHLFLHFSFSDHLVYLLSSNTLLFGGIMLQHTEWLRNGDAVLALLLNLGRLDASLSVVLLSDLGLSEVLRVLLATARALIEQLTTMFLSFQVILGIVLRVIFRLLSAFIRTI